MGSKHNSEPTGCGLDKFALMKRLDARGIDTRPFFSQLSKLPAFADRPQAARFLPADPAGRRIADYGVNLPSGYAMDEGKVACVAAALIDILDSRSS